MNKYKCLKCKEISNSDEWNNYSKERNKYAVKNGLYIDIDYVFDNKVEDDNFKYNCPKCNSICFTNIRYGLGRYGKHIEKV